MQAMSHACRGKKSIGQPWESLKRLEGQLPCHTTAPALMNDLVGEVSLSRRSGSAALLEAFPAEHRPPLSGLEWHGGLLAALRAGGGGFHPLATVIAERLAPPGLARLAAFRLVLESLVRKEELLAGSEDELRPAVDALEDLVLEFH